jgi:cyclopropane fatty-acyl-phospholipid synthase-like methyltransferase
MSYSEKILIKFSKDTTAVAQTKNDQSEWNVENALSILTRVYPDFLSLIKDKRILDFGCGLGYQTVAFTLHGAASVVGVDISKEDLDVGNRLAKKHNLADKVSILQKVEPTPSQKFD